MIAITFSPSVSSKDIEEALDAQVDARSSQNLQAQLSEEKKAFRLKLLKACAGTLAFSLFLMLLGSLILRGRQPYIAGMRLYVLFIVLIGALFILALIVVFFADLFPPPQKKPEGIFQGFYGNLLGAWPSYHKAYRMLAPSTMARMPLAHFRKAWERVPETLKSLVATQDKACCSKCGKEGFGLWTFPSGGQFIVLTGEVILSNKYLASSQDFFHCPKCEWVYCASCFLALPGRGACQGCSTLLKGRALKTLMVKPDIICGYLLAQDRSKVVEQEPGKTARIICEIKSTDSSQYSAPWEKSQYHKLGEKGVLTCRFHNAAVRIGERWYVVAGDPGVMERQPD